MDSDSSAESPALPEPAESVRARILRAALECFAREGFDRTTVKAIARRCGLSDAGIFYYFPSKRHLLEALWKEAPGGDFPQPAAEAPLSAATVRELVAGTMRLSAQNFLYLRLVVNETLNGDETAWALRSESRARWRRALLRHFEPVAGSHAGDLVDLVMATITGFLIRIEIETGERYPEAVCDPAWQERVADAVLRILPPDILRDPAPAR